MHLFRNTLLAIGLLVFTFVPASGQTNGGSFDWVDIGVARPSNAEDIGLYVNDTATVHNSLQLVEHTNSNSGGLLFNAYKDVQVSGPMSKNGNTRYTGSPGSWQNGAGMIEFWGNYGSMHFFVSPKSTGMGNTIDWGGAKLTIRRSGNVGIGITSPSHKLTVDGTIRAKEIIVDTGWSDFVFEDGYDLMSLDDVESYIHKHRHLPEIPSAEMVAEEGVSLGAMDAKLLQKIEELTLYTIEQESTINRLVEQLDALEARLDALEE